MNERLFSKSEKPLVAEKFPVMCGCRRLVEKLRRRGRQAA
jgi:hypothetical protein